jgi:rSAM/selenodomain-associated transferase 2
MPVYRLPEAILFPPVERAEDTGRVKRFSIVIPVLHEEEELDGLLTHLQGLPGAEECELLVVDGGEGETLRAVTRGGVLALRTPRGRAKQLNAGAAAASGEILLFLHADSRLPENALRRIAEAMQRPEIAGGAFDLGIDSDRPSLRFIASVASFRSRITRVPYGDQAQFIRRDVFLRMGGYPDIPLMEDVALMRRLRREGRRIRLIPERVLTSPRRWEKEGIVYTTVRNRILMAAYSLGVSPERLARHYRSGRDVYGQDSRGVPR